MFKYLTLLMVIISVSLLAQETPKDFLKAEFHQDRRGELRKAMPDNSVAVFFANPVRNRANDVDYIYHQDPNFYYLSGYQEPHAVLMIFKDYQDMDGDSYNEILFVQPRDIRAEMWNGRRLGDLGAKEKLAFEQVFNNTDFKAYNVDFESFDAVLFSAFFEDTRDTNDESDLHDLIIQFKEKAKFPGFGGQSLALEPEKSNLDTKTLSGIMSDLRGIKTAEELVLIRKAVDISCVGQVEVMKAMKPGISETEIQGIHEFVFKKYNTEYEGYPSIVGAGNNGCILHYIENNKPEVSSKEMILMDLGAEYHGYTADITRTIPTNGKFSKEQKIIYDIVYDAQEAAIQMIKPGVTFQELGQVARNIINKRLAELGIIKSETERHMYYPHGLSHHIGLDVHDAGNYESLEENMVITVEPGIYIPKGSDCDEKWWDIAVRIEDDVLITKDGFELLSTIAPRTTEAIEAMMKLPSPLDSFVLPDLDRN